MADFTKVHRTTCRLFHAWSKWDEPQNGRRKRNGVDVGSLIWQERTCLRCGLAQIREIAG